MPFILATKGQLISKADMKMFFISALASKMSQLKKQWLLIMPINDFYH